MAQKFVIEVHEVPEEPTNWTSKEAWPHTGLFMVQGKNGTLYNVGDWSVDYISVAAGGFLGHPITDSELNPAITESLFLKAISAAANSKNLS